MTNFKTILTKHFVTQVLSLDLKKVPVYFNWSAITNFKFLRELDRGESDVKDNACVRCRINMQHGRFGLSDFFGLVLCIYNKPRSHAEILS